MDEKLQKALEFSNYRQTLNSQLQKARIRSENALIFAKNGGSFKVNQELICFLDYLIRSDQHTSVLLDSNNIPVLIENIPEFFEEISSRYFESLNDYLREYQTIRKTRNVKSLLDMKE